MEDFTPEGLNQPIDDATCDIVAEFFSVYSNPTRIHIFCALSTGSKSVSQLAEHAKTSLQNISQHLRVMKDKGALVSEKKGQHVYYSVADPKFLYGVKMIRDALIETLKSRVEAIPSALQTTPAKNDGQPKGTTKRSA